MVSGKHKAILNANRKGFDSREIYDRIVLIEWFAFALPGDFYDNHAAIWHFPFVRHSKRTCDKIIFTVWLTCRKCRKSRLGTCRIGECQWINCRYRRVKLPIACFLLHYAQVQSDVCNSCAHLCCLKNVLSHFNHFWNGLKIIGTKEQKPLNQLLSRIAGIFDDRGEKNSVLSFFLILQFILFFILQFILFFLLTV